MNRMFQSDGRWAPLILLLGLAYAYGAIHAAGPGHGKVVAMSCVLSRRPSVLGGVGLGMCIAMIHGLSGIVGVLGLHFIIQRSISQTLASVTENTQKAMIYSPLNIYWRIVMSKTQDNLKTAFLGESEARNKYSYFAQVARSEGYHYIAKIFEETAENEKYHAMEEIKLLLGERSTLDNLKEAVGGENYESESMYPRFAKEADLEGNQAAAILFTQIAKIEKHHRDRFNNLLTLVENQMVFKRSEPIKWKCSVCGYVYEGTEPPPRCPYCKHPQEYYEPASLDV